MSSLNKVARMLKEAAEDLGRAHLPLLHISGPSGSGKTMLLKDLAARYPEIVTKDTDDFGEGALRQMGINPSDAELMKWDAKQEEDYTEQVAARYHEFLKGVGSKPVVLGGFSTESGGKRIAEALIASS